MKKRTREERNKLILRILVIILILTVVVTYSITFVGAFY